MPDVYLRACLTPCYKRAAYSLQYETRATCGVGLKYSATLALRGVQGEDRLGDGEVGRISRNCTSLRLYMESH